MNYFFLTLLLVGIGSGAMLGTQTIASQDEGKALTAELAKVKRKWDEADHNWISSRGPRGSGAPTLAGTFDAVLIDQHLLASLSLHRAAARALHRLSYSEAKAYIDEANSHLDALNIILSESRTSPESIVRLESVLDDQLVPTEHLPQNKSGRALRAYIASELSFSERMAAKAGVKDFALLKAIPALRANSCAKANDEYLLRTLALAHSFNLGTEYSNTIPPAAFFTLAKKELSLLRYERAHSMAYVAYRAAIEMMEVCGSGTIKR